MKFTGVTKAIGEWCFRERESRKRKRVHRYAGEEGPRGFRAVDF